jgi:preprotein translocase subunit YajC
MLCVNGYQIHVGSRVVQVGGVVEAIVMSIDENTGIVTVRTDDEMNRGEVRMLHRTEVEVLRA